MSIKRPVTHLTIVALLAATVLLASGRADAGEEAVTAQNAGQTLNGRLTLAEGKGLGDGVVLITHGTLAHNGVEAIRGAQAALQERGVNSLAITLSLGLDKRTGLYDCAVPHRHKHEDALDEIGVWLGWLKGRGAKNIVLMGHSRGGNQTARFTAERPNGLVTRVVLLAPQVWDAEARLTSYERAYGTPLQPLLDRAQALVAAGKGGEMLKNTGFIYCPGAEVSAAAFVSYYQNDARMHTPALIPKIAVPILVIAASEDQVVKGLPEAVASLVDGEKVAFILVDGADHNFLDFYIEDVADAIVEFAFPGS